MVSNYSRFHTVTGYLRRYTPEWIVVALGIPTLVQLFEEVHYKNLEGGVLEAPGRLLSGSVTLCVYPCRNPESAEIVDAGSFRAVPRLHHLYDYNYVIASDGDMMEWVSSEPASLAWHLGLGKLNVFYDSNRITIEGSTELAFSEDMLKRFDSYGWRTLPAIAALVARAKSGDNRPTIIRLESVIGKEANVMEGKHKEGARSALPTTRLTTAFDRAVT
jgi:hypothetical protein